MSTLYAITLHQVERVTQLCDFLEHQDLAEADISVPVRMPNDILSFDTGLSIGFALVGLWSALDAYAERAGVLNVNCPICGRGGCLAARFKNAGRLAPAAEASLQEIEDLRHLFAHNFAGRADKSYFAKKRHVLKSKVVTQLASGAAFDGASVVLTAQHLRYYAARSREALKCLG